MSRFIARMGLFLAVLLLAACNNNSNSSGGNGGGSDSDTVEWDRSASTIVFRADVVGGDPNVLYLKNDVPYCTIYGDGRVVWTVQAGGASTQVLWDRLDDNTIRAFVGTLVVNQRFYTYKAGADQQPASQNQPVIEQLTLNVNKTEQKSDGFSGWPQNYFQDILDMCRKLSKAPITFAPDAAWVSAESADYDTRAPSIIWDGVSSGLSLKDLAASAQAQWVKGQNAVALWNMIHTSTLDVQFSEGEGNYHVAVQVPGVTRGSPDAPKS